MPVEWNGLEGRVAYTDKKAEAVIEQSDESEVNLADSSRFDMKATASFTSADIRQAINVTDGRLDTFWDNRVAVSRSLAFNISIPRETSLDVSYVELDWEAYQTMSELDLYFVLGDMLEDADGKMPSRDFFQMGTTDTPRKAAMPEKIAVEYWDGYGWNPVSNSETTFAQASLEPTCVRFDTITTQRIRIHMFNATPYTPEGTVQLSEIQAYASERENAAENTSAQNAENAAEETLENVEEVVAKRAAEVVDLFAQKEYEKVFDLCNLQMVGNLLGYSSLMTEMWEDLLANYGEFVEAEDVIYKSGSDGCKIASYRLRFEQAHVTFDIEIDSDYLLHNVSVIKAESIE